MICALCLSRQVVKTASELGARSNTLKRLRTTAALGLSLLLLWMLFYSFGSLLLRIPAAVHDGTVWRDSTPQRE